jgi:hypothetical protein
LYIIGRYIGEQICGKMENHNFGLKGDQGNGDGNINVPRSSSAPPVLPDYYTTNLVTIPFFATSHFDIFVQGK